VLESIPVELDASCAMSLFSKRKNNFYGRSLSDNEFQPYSNFEMGGVYNFSDRSQRELIEVKYDSKTRFGFSSDVRTDYYVSVKGDVRRRWGIRSGLFRYAQSITDYDADGKSIEFADGTTFLDAENA
jgi:hypothetical protein